MVAVAHNRKYFNSLATMKKKYISVYELSIYLGVSRNKVYNMVKTNEIPYYNISNCIRFNLDEVEDWNLINRVRSFEEE
jgi:excisionase family DNA binding protein